MPVPALKLALPKSECTNRDETHFQAPPLAWVNFAMTLAINGLFEQLDSLVWPLPLQHGCKVALLTFLGAGHLHPAVMELEVGLARHPFLTCRSLSHGHFRLIDLYRDRLHDDV